MLTEDEGVKRGTTNYLYGLSQDGIASTLSLLGQIEVPETVAGCFRHEAIQRTVFELPNSNPEDIGLQNGGIAGFTIQPKSAADALLGGFVQQAIWVGVGGGSAVNEWIEVGVTQGAEIAPDVYADVHRYFSAYGDLTGVFAVQLLPGVPTHGSQEYFKVINCEVAGGGFADISCPGSPFVPTGPLSPGTWVGCADVTPNGTGNNCTTWDAALASTISGEPVNFIGPGAADMHVGVESTCGLSSVDTTEVVGYRFRRTAPLVWLNVNPTNIANSRTNLLKAPSPSSIHGTDCCFGLQSGSNSQCKVPKDFIYFHNTSISTQVPQACTNQN